jgi:hypothetical protein
MKESDFRGVPPPDATPRKILQGLWECVKLLVTPAPPPPEPLPPKVVVDVLPYQAQQAPTGATVPAKRVVDIKFRDTDEVITINHR